MTINTQSAIEALNAFTNFKQADHFAIDMRSAGRYDLAALAEDRAADLCTTSAAAQPRRDAANVDRRMHIKGM